MAKLSSFTKALLALGAGLAGIGALTIVILATQRDNGLIEEGGCPVAWKRGNIPIFIALDPTAADWEKPLKEALEFWSDARPGLFLYGGVMDQTETSGSIVGVVATSGAPNSLTRLGVNNCVINGGVVEVRMEEKNQRRVITHELGHVLGLAHDDQKASVMYPASVPGEFHVTKKDLALLQATYGP